jgi:hypothetical protein
MRRRDRVPAQMWRGGADTLHAAARATARLCGASVGSGCVPRLRLTAPPGRRPTRAETEQAARRRRAAGVRRTGIPVPGRAPSRSSLYAARQAARCLYASLSQTRAGAIALRRRNRPDQARTQGTSPSRIPVRRRAAPFGPTAAPTGRKWEK